MPKVFISHTHGDKEIADALNKAIHSLFGDVVKVEYSTKKEAEGGIAHGEDWYDWIVDQVTGADVAYVLLTPGSIQKPWILWEAGAVAGVAMAAERMAGTEGAKPRKVRPLIFHLKASEIPSPFQSIQARNGDSPKDVELLFQDLLEVVAESLDHKAVLKAGQQLKDTIATYLERISAAILRAPMMVSESIVQEWLQRIDKFEKRPSEIDQLHDWMKVAFGRSDEQEDRPIDLRIHRRLAELYSNRGTLDSRRKAVHQFELARQLASRDIFILRQLGNAYIAIERYEETADIISQIESLDSEAFKRNAECAAMRGKWLRKINDPQTAADVYATGLQHNRDSYYLANLAAEASLEAGNTGKAKEFYDKSLKIIETLSEENIWTWSSAANASFALGQNEKAKFYLGRIAADRPGKDELNIIEGGLRLVKTKFNLSEGLFTEMADTLQGKEA